MITIQNVIYTIGEHRILQDMNFTVQEGHFVGIIGPNGCGKSTMLKLLYRYFQLQQGTIVLHEQDLMQVPQKIFAKQVAVVSQDSPVLFDFSVKEMVYMGRTPHKKWLESDTASDEEIVLTCMQRTNIAHLAERSFGQLSGGEKKRVLLARALAQQAQILILDEPTNHLDIEHQFQLMDLVADLPITIIAALHDLNLAASYCDELIVMQKGEIYAMGRSEDVLTQQMLMDVFHIQADISRNPFTNKPHLLFYSNAQIKTP
ncbi:ABC transporter ATP-binding protein [Lysinibacillus piscis]|uniref:ABC transporter n=1 Tax=Lysinibacillus piscis TaxID=2518931 RepID=A0ABQ5NJH7_9BACI|nr:ABC transporter ATP-binding protein [Lysinibacillus sp. KH24]GLC88439.1 ABC transporter [Lysinibacillus sp. KH24]